MKRVLSSLFRLVPSRVLRAGLFLANAKFNHGAVGVFTDSEGRILLLRHVFRKTFPWGFPSGFVNVGETASEAAVRELKEETGLVGTITHADETFLVAPHHLETLVHGRVERAENFTLSHEIFEARWVTPGQVPDDIVLASPPAHRDILQGKA